MTKLLKGYFFRRITNDRKKCHNSSSFIMVSEILHIDFIPVSFLQAGRRVISSQSPEFRRLPDIPGISGGISGTYAFGEISANFLPGVSETDIVTKNNCRVAVYIMIT